MQNYSSKIFENTVNQMAKLPGIGRRTAVRLTLHLLKQPKEDIVAFASAVTAMKEDIFYCEICHNISDSPQCEICRNPQRQTDIVCVVQDIRDVIAIENTGIYKGVYHVLGGVISPMNGIGISELNIQSLFDRLQGNAVSELVLALPATTEGDTTAYYLYKHIQSLNNCVRITTIARGISVGEELEYTDEATLSRSLLNRVDFESSIRK